MQKGGLLRLLAVVTLLILAPDVDAAPLISEEPDLRQVPSSLNGGDQKPPDPWTSGPDFQEMTATVSPVHLLWMGPVKTYSDSYEKREPRKTSDRPAKATNSPSYLVKTLAVTNSLGKKLKTARETINSDGFKKTIQVDRHSTIDPVTGKMEGYATMEESSLHKQLTPVTTNSNKQDKAMRPARRAKMNLATSSPDRREKIAKLLSTLEEIHRSMNSTWYSHIAIIPKGNSNNGSLGKKRKMAVTDRNLKSTTVSSVVSSATSSKASTVDAEPKHLNGKVFKKSLPSTTKKTNKRVCFWKYCSQN
ncbi:urotensin II-related peptide isoform X1 [Electrophorus electricus]|nr:urotensin II-related peptide isoform X1 [Electrophorus electricus]